MHLRIPAYLIKGDTPKRHHVACNCYATVCPPVQGDNPRALASGLSSVQANKPRYTCNYFIPPSL